ncbi:hypothetical protein CRYUN_Cryun12cG0145800 [Craigia yunnanensis]
MLRDPYVGFLLVLLSPWAKVKSSSQGPGAVRDVATQIRDGLLQASHQTALTFPSVFIRAFTNVNGNNACWAPTVRVVTSSENLCFNSAATAVLVGGSVDGQGSNKESTIQAQTGTEFVESPCCYVNAKVGSKRDESASCYTEMFAMGSNPVAGFAFSPIPALVDVLHYINQLVRQNVLKREANCWSSEVSDDKQVGRH